MISKTDSGCNRIDPVYSRREMLLKSGAGFGALALSYLLRDNALFAQPGPLQGSARPLGARPAHFAAKAKSVIFCFMEGGPSHLDTFDPKPLVNRLAGQRIPDSFRPVITPMGEFYSPILPSRRRWARHGQSGLWVSDWLPHIATCADDLAVIRSCWANGLNHSNGVSQMNTGSIVGGRPSLGAWVTYGLGTENQNLPGYVLLFEAGPLGGAANYSNGFLPPAFQPTRLRDHGTPVLDLLPPDEFAPGQRDSLKLIQQLNLRHREQRPGFSELEARIASYELAYRMQSPALEVGNLDTEPQYLRQSYGLEDADQRTVGFARKCLLARRLVERGVRFVQMYDMAEKDGWDAHEMVIKNHPPRARWTDQPIAALLGDLKQRGLLDTTLVVWASEFGRTPMMQGDHGRQHNAAGFTIWMAGGGVRPGARIGATDEIGLMAVDQPQPFHNLHATILSALGLGHEDLGYEVNGRVERLTGVAGSAGPIRGVLA